MELLRKIQKLLEEIIRSVPGISDCTIVTSDGFNIISSSAEVGNSEIDGDIISEVLNAANKITDLLVKEKAEKFILDFSKRKILIVGLSDHIFLVFLTKKNFSQALILLGMEPQIKLLKNLVKNY